MYVVGATTPAHVVALFLKKSKKLVLHYLMLSVLEYSHIIEFYP